MDVFAVQPGLTSTSLYSGMQKTFLFYWFFVLMTFMFGQSPERGCLSLLYCATAPELQGMTIPPSRSCILPSYPAAVLLQPVMLGLVGECEFRNTEYGSIAVV